MSATDRHPAIVESHRADLTPGDILRLHWPDEAATQRFAQGLAQQPGLRNAFIALRGNLGAGKTTLTRHLLGALGVRGRIKSPTYTVVESYELPDLNLWHFDFYRFQDPQEWEDAGFRDIFASPGLKLAEWPDKAQGLLPPADLTIELETQADESRHVVLTAGSSAGTKLLRALQQAELESAVVAATVPAISANPPNAAP